MEAIDEQRVGDAAEQFFDDGIQGGHKKPGWYHTTRYLVTPARPINRAFGTIT